MVESKQRVYLLSQPVDVRLNHPFMHMSHCIPVTPSIHEHWPPYLSHTTPSSAPSDPPQAHSVEEYYFSDANTSFFEAEDDFVNASVPNACVFLCIT